MQCQLLHIYSTLHNPATSSEKAFHQRANVTFASLRSGVMFSGVTVDLVTM